MRPDLRVGFIVLNHFTLIPVAGLADSLRFAADRSFRSEQIFCQWDWMTPDNQPAIASCGLQVSPTRPLGALEHYDYLIVAGGLLDEVRRPPEALLQRLREAHASGQTIISLCSGSFVLGNAGLLDGRKCAVHFTIKEEFMERFPKTVALTDRSYVVDDRIITCPGGTAIDLAAYIIRKHCGERRADKGLRYLLIENVAGETPVAPHPSDTDARSHSLLNEAIRYMQRNLGASVTLGELAQAVGSNPQQLRRVFVRATSDTPAGYWRKLKLERAKFDLSQTDLSVTTIAMQCGFSDSSHFIVTFRRQYGETPSAYRKSRQAADKLIDG